MLAVESKPDSARRSSSIGEAPEVRHFFGPIRDFLLLGGVSFLILPLALLTPAATEPVFKVATALLSLVINYPHFAHSYQLFYRDFTAKAGMSAPAGLRFRYLLAGVIVPLAGGGFLVVTIASGEMRTLGLAGNIMSFFVGWHYVKQAYGMLIVDGVLKRQFFSKNEKTILLLNAYAVWSLTWISLNTAGQARSLWGVDYFVLDLPVFIQTLAAALTVLTSCMVAGMLISKFTRTKSLPLAGTAAYLCGLYLWMLFARIDPIWALFIPALHSLQYLVVVWRYEINKNLDPHNSLESNGSSQKGNLLRFSLIGIGLGVIGFWLVPLLFELLIPTASSLNNSVFLFSFWVLINVHHYFIDNVIWRSENPSVKKYLFASSSPPASAAVAGPV